MRGYCRCEAVPAARLGLRGRAERVGVTEGRCYGGWLGIGVPDPGVSEGAPVACETVM